MIKNGKLSKNNKLSSEMRQKFDLKKIILIATSIIISPIICYLVFVTIVIVNLYIKESQAIASYSKEIEPVVSAHISDPNVQFSYYRFEEIIMPQFDIKYSPQHLINFYTVLGGIKNKPVEKNPLLGVSVKNIITQETCSFDFYSQNYDFINNQLGFMSDKLIDLYDHRQQIIDDFVAQQPECFKLLPEQ